MSKPTRPKKNAAAVKPSDLFIYLEDPSGENRHWTLVIRLEDPSGLADLTATRFLGKSSAEQALLTAFDLGLGLAVQTQKLSLRVYTLESRLAQWFGTQDARPKIPRMNPEVRELLDSVTMRWSTFQASEIKVGPHKSIDALKLRTRERPRRR